MRLVTSQWQATSPFASRGDDTSTLPGKHAICGLCFLSGKKLHVVIQEQMIIAHCAEKMLQAAYAFSMRELTVL